MTKQAFDFDHLTTEELPQAFRLGGCLIEKYSPDSVSDFGCATGLYLIPFILKGAVVFGYEQDLAAKERCLIDDDLIHWGDILDDFHYSALFRPPKTDLVLCLEVMEHIPEELSDRAVERLTEMSDRIIFSAAIPGQGGVGHINCQYKAYWEEKFAKHGYYNKLVPTLDILNYMTSGYHMGWLRQNLMVLEKDV